MNIKKSVRKTLTSSDFGNHIFFQIRRVREKIELAKENDLQYIERIYRERFGESINWKEPQTYQAKLQWLKLFYRNSKMPICSDKYMIREYLTQNRLNWLANEIIGIYDDARDIELDKLPNKFVVKATHGSGWNYVCEDKRKVNWESQLKIMSDWLKLNLYVFGREWNYKDIQPRLIVEKYIDHKPLNDYKYMCFNGEPLFMQLNNDHEGEHFVDFYKIDNWKHFPCTYGPYQYSKDREIEKPPQHEKMMDLARQLSRPFPFVRVDFYNFDDTIILGELTYFPGGGLWPFTPREVGKKYDKYLGAYLNLPEPNYNLELYNKLCRRVGGGTTLNNKTTISIFIQESGEQLSCAWRWAA